MTSKKEQPDSTVEDPNRELTPDEIKEHLSRLKETYCTDLKNEVGIEVIFPEGTKIGSIDVSGKSLEDVFNMLMEPLESYEPPIIQKQVESEMKAEASEVPSWLKGHEELIWKGAHENPIWKAQGQQYGDEVILSYARKGKELKPGKNELEQGRGLEAVKNKFTVDEWKVVKQIFDEYEKLENNLESDDKELKKDAKNEVQEIIKEENAFRKGKGEVPQTIYNKISEAIEEVSKKTRGFKKDNIDQEALTQQTAEILSQLIVLNRSRGDGRDKVPTAKSDIKETPSFEYSLKLIAECLSNQLNAKSDNLETEGSEDFKNEKDWYKNFENAKGISLMIGEAGTGKNEAVEYTAAKTKRPYFWFPCGRGMEAIDLVTHYEFDTKEGTKRFLTELAEGIQTPGAIVMIDEVNSLKPEVQAILHGLGDSNRSLNYDGVRIPVAEGVVIIIAGNPATYGSAGDLGQALLSRTRGQSMVMEYPALKKGDLLKRKEQWSDSVLEQKEQENNELRDYACDEALVLYSNFNEFSGLSDQEFSLLWDCVINESTQGTRINELENNPKLKNLLEGHTGEHIRKTLTDLRDILRVTDAWRKHYEKRSGGLDIIGVSMRDTIAIAKAYKDERDVRKAYLKVFSDFRKNPIDGLDSAFKSLEQLINDTLGQV